MRRILTGLFVVLLIVEVTALLDLTECGKSKHCDGSSAHGPCDLQEDNCDFVFSYKPSDEETVLFELQGRLEANEQYIAVGFSEDAEMGDDQVIACVPAESGFKAQFSYNQGKSNVPSSQLSDKDAPESPHLIEYTASNGRIYCKFSQKVNEGVTGSKLVKDLSKPTFVLLAQGSMNENELSYHSTRSVSAVQHLLVKKTPDEEQEDQPVSKDAKVEEKIVKKDPELKQANEVGSGPFALSMATKFVILRYHGVAMLFGWLGFLFTGVFSARYLRNLWPNTTVGGLKIWFHIHRILNTIGVLLVVMGAVFVFVSKDLTWTGPTVEQDQRYNMSPGAIHSLLGVISVLLALLQPFGALFRCGLTHRRRPVFNVLHRSGGLLAVLLAAGSVVIAVLYFTSLWQSRVLSLAVLIAFLTVAVLLAVAQEVVKFKEESEQQRVVAIEMRNRSKQVVPSDSYYFRERQAHSDRHKKVTVFLFIAFVLVGFVSATLLAYLILDA